MAKASADKLAEALRANLKRRKQAKAAAPEPPPETGAKPVQKPPKIGH